MAGCIFCKIANGEFDSAKVWEDKEFMAFLDINPNTEGMCLVIPKKHYPSDAFLMPECEYEKLLSAARKVAAMLKSGLGVERVAMAMEGMGVNHVHIKLYPLYGIKNSELEINSGKRVFFEKYPGYISTKMGPEKKLADLKKTAEKIRKQTY